MAFRLIAPEGKIILSQYTQQTKSGIIVPDAEKGESRIGIVYAFGAPLKKDPKIKLKKGQLIVFKKYVSNTLFISEINDSFDFLEYEDIVAILTEEK